ncbi:MAG: polysaccharide biosynthesis PFTS motif protein [Nitrospirae bacterium]|nr:polysaccharide biosynthesis PFTS motif protein [Nitrospirota bacterium]
MDKAKKIRKNKSNCCVVFHTPALVPQMLIKLYIERGFSVYVIEPFSSSLYDNSKYSQFPPHLTPYVYKLIKKGTITLITTREIDYYASFSISNEIATNNGERFFTLYKKKLKHVIDAMYINIDSIESELIFRKHCVYELVNFYTVNCLLNKLQAYLPFEQIIVYPFCNVLQYKKIKTMVKDAGCDFFDDHRITLPISLHVSGVFRILKDYLTTITLLFGQTVMSVILSKSNKQSDKSYTCGISVISPDRQLSNVGREPNFFLHEDSYKSTIVFIYNNIKKIHLKKLHDLKIDYYLFPSSIGFFSHPLFWWRLLGSSLKTKALFDNSLKVASISLLKYLHWKHVLSIIKVGNFISNNDYYYVSIVRNIALKQSGCQTWIFQDSAGWDWNYFNSDCWIKGKSYCLSYLNYDHYIVWSKHMSEFLDSHPNVMNTTKYHVVGTLWSKNLSSNEIVYTSKQLQTILDQIETDSLFIISLFDTSYLENTMPSFMEGIAFINDFIKLLDDEQDVFIMFKEKAPRYTHALHDPDNGQVLFDAYEELSSHNRVLICGNDYNVEYLKHMSNVTISCPFTSPTNEALSINQPAIWHDALGMYRKSVWGRIGGVMTHSYEELRAFLHQLMTSPKRYINPVPEGFPYIDPYRDGKAVDRFREILINNLAIQ